MAEDNENNNIFSMVRGGKNDPAPQEEKLPFNSYKVRDIENNEYYARGFLIFTSAHVAVMQEGPGGAAPVLILPLARLAVAELASA